jgi:hypothetical protein
MKCSNPSCNRDVRADVEAQYGDRDNVVCTRCFAIRARKWGHPVRATGTAKPKQSGLEPYWKRLKPVIEYEYRHDSGEAFLEIVVFDDRDATGEVKAQFFPILSNGRRGKALVLTLDSLTRVEELAADFTDLADLLRK